MLLLLGFILPTAYVFANSETATKKDGAPIVVIEKTGNVGFDKSNSISAYISGNTLTVAFTENLGLVDIEITNDTGMIMNFASLETPTGYQFFINIPGRYTVTFTLPNGDGYYGEFEVDE